MKTVRTIIKCIIAITILSMVFVGAFLLYDRVVIKKSDVSGNWRREINLTDEAVVAAVLWLGELDGYTPTAEQLKETFGNLTVTVELTFDRSGKVWEEKINEQSYKECREKAYHALASEFERVLTDRLAQAGYSQEKSSSEVVKDALGMTTEEYFDYAGVELLPAYETLTKAYNGHGTYTTKEGVLYRDSVSRAYAETFMLSDNTLILSGDKEARNGIYMEYPYVYSREVQE